MYKPCKSFLFIEEAPITEEMHLIYLFCSVLIFGMGLSQFFDLTPYRQEITLAADISLAYIMMEVGLEFVMDKKNWKSYIKDYFVAAAAAALPWIFCFVYFFWMIGSNSWQETLLIARFAAPTSSGILFSMLAAAGLGMTWLFRKVEILAILDDIDTILLLIPLQFLLGGGRYILISVVGFIIVLIFLAWRYLHVLRIPSGRLWLLTYSIVLTTALHAMNHWLGVELEILLPAFVLGCLIYNPHDPRHRQEHIHEHAYIEAEERPLMFLDRCIKTLFMLVVGLLLPKVPFRELNLGTTLFHVLLITVVSNLGKCLPIFFYRNEATLRERTAVCIGMFPRGEVGAGILVLAIEHGATGYVLTLAGLSLALNLLLTGVFISIAIKLVRKEAT